MNPIFVLLLFLLPWATEAASLPKPRTALVLGNARYEASVGPLRNTENDARLVAKTLRGLGFAVIEKHNLTRDQLLRATLEFRATLTQAEVGIFYYAGHGISVGGANYLIPIKSGYSPDDVDASSLRLLAETKLFNVEQILADMSGAGARCNLVILDACRTTAVARIARTRDLNSPGGLTEMKPPAGSLIAFATDAGQTALDGTGSNGLYTEELLKHLRTPGLTIEQVFKRTRAAVLERSGGGQIPAEYSRLVGEDIFLAGPLAPTPTPPEIAVRKAEAAPIPSLKAIQKLAAAGKAIECVQSLRRLAQNRGPGTYAVEPLQTLLDQVRDMLKSSPIAKSKLEEAVATCSLIFDSINDCLIKGSPEDALLRSKSLNRRGDVLMQLQQPTDALRDFESALALAPTDPYILYNRGCSYQILARTEDAKADFSKILSPQFPPSGAKKLATRALESLQKTH